MSENVFLGCAARSAQTRCPTGIVQGWLRSIPQDRRPYVMIRGEVVFLQFLLDDPSILYVWVLELNQYIP